MLLALALQVVSAQAVDTAAIDARIAAVAAATPKPATTMPMAETTSPAIGTDTARYALANHTHPRVSWSPVVQTVAGGTFSGTIPAGMFTAVTIDLSWVVGGSLPVTCRLTSYSLTAFAGVCHTLSPASILAAGAGIEVHVVVLPRSGV